jgi:hypothetical protein
MPVIAATLEVETEGLPSDAHPGKSDKSYLKSKKSEKGLGDGSSGRLLA